MFSADTIQRMSDEAAYRAARDDKRPLFFWRVEDARHLPFLGGYVPAGWRYATWSEITDRPRTARYVRDEEHITLLVDATGFGDPHEPALTIDEFGEVATNGKLAWAIREAGQFQVVVGAYVKDDAAPGIPAPDIEIDDEEGD